MNLSEPFIRRPAMTVLLTTSAILFGILAYLNMPVNDLPAVDYPVITVNVNYPGATPDTMAATVATPLEKQFMQIPGLKIVTSNSGQGHTSFTLEFKLEKSIDAAATDVQAAITQAQGSLPQDLPSPPVFSKTNPNDQPIMYIALTSNSVTAGQLYDYASTQVSQQISILSGVSQVQVYGTKSAIRVKADPGALAARAMTMDELSTAILQGTAYEGAGQFDGSHTTFLLQPHGQLDSAAEYRNLVLKTINREPVYLKDVAQVEDTVQDERINMRFWARGYDIPTATVVLAVFRQAGSNAVQVADEIRGVAPEIQRQLPTSVRITPIYDRSRSIVDSVDDVKLTLYVAFALVVMVIFIFLGRATDTLIPVVAMPLSLLITFICMNILNYSMDNLSLMALTLAIGFLVDDAIVFLENTVSHLEHGMGPFEATIHSAKQISFTILSMTVSLAAVFLPLVFMSGLIGRIFREFAVTIIIAILASGVVSLTLTPMMCSRMLGRRGHDVKKSWMERLTGGVINAVIRLYGSSLWFFLRHKWVSALVWIASLAGTFWFFEKVPKAFLPVGDSGFISGVVVAQEGSSPEQMHHYQDQADAILHSNPNVGMTFTLSGANQFFPPNLGLVLAFLKPINQREPIQQVNKELSGQLMMGMKGVFAPLHPNPVLQISTGAASLTQGQYSYVISGGNPQEVYAAAGKFMGALMPYQGKVFQSIQPDMYLHTPQLVIDPKRDQAALYHVSVKRIEDLIREAYSQNYVYLIKRPQDQYQLIVEASDNDRKRPEDLGRLYIKSDDGQRMIPLNAVASWRESVGPQSVNHFNQFTSVTFSFNLIPGVPVGSAAKIITDTAAKVLPPSIKGQLQGEAQTFAETMNSLIILMALAVFVMYVILGILYESYIHPITVLSALPVALVGGLATLYFMNAEASLYAFIGMFMLMGIVKKNGIMMIDFAQQRIAAGSDSLTAIHEASIDRFRPIIMTTLAALMGAVPIAIGIGADGESRKPLGYVIVGGLIFSQFVTLYVTPAIYLYLEAFQEKVLDRIPFFRSSHHLHDGEQPLSHDDMNGQGELANQLETGGPVEIDYRGTLPK